MMPALPEAEATGSVLDSWELHSALAQRRADGLYRWPRTVDSAQGPLIQLAGETLLAFCSNDYLGLAADPAISAAFKRGLDRYGSGAGASHLVCGHMRPHQELEEALAAFTGRDRALLFSSGYLANLGLITALLGKQDAVFQDRLNHASLLDGGLLSGARFSRYQHADSGSLNRQLACREARRRLVVTDGVFSMDGDLAPLPELAGLCTDQRALLMVDDAHGLGVLGPNGSGTTAHFGLGQRDVPLLMGTLGKAFGVCGAFVAGPTIVIETLVQHARSYIYTTALPPAAASATLAALRLVEEGTERRQYLHSLIQRFRNGARQLDLPLADSETAIQPLMAGSADTALRWSGLLQRKGILVPAIRPPTVPAGAARLRIALSAAHSELQVDRLLDELARLPRRLA